MQYVREAMMADLRMKGIHSASVVRAMTKVPRHFFVSEALRYSAYHDMSLPIGFGQTISKPSVIGRMVQALNLTGRERILEVGTGSGYQSAILAELCANVVSTERIRDLSQRAAGVLARLGYNKVSCVHTDSIPDAEGFYDAIIVAAVTDILPPDLLTRIKDGGVLVIPIGDQDGHRIRRYVKHEQDEFFMEEIGVATFVPLLSGVSNF